MSEKLQRALNAFAAATTVAAYEHAKNLGERTAPSEQLTVVLDAMIECRRKLVGMGVL